MQGKVMASRVVEVRFVKAGKLSFLKINLGEEVKKGQVLAGLDKKGAQIDLDIDLADYRRARAEFDRIAREISLPKDDDEKNKKEVYQARLDASVKRVEKSKLSLDQLTLISPVKGIVLDTNNLVVGLNITPSGWPIKILDLDSLVFEIKVSKEKKEKIQVGYKAKIELENKQKIESKVIWISEDGEGKEKKYYKVHFEIENKKELLGLKGEVKTIKKP